MTVALVTRTGAALPAPAAPTVAISRMQDQPAASPPLLPSVQVLAMWRVLPGALMLLGRAARGAAPPASGTAQVQFAPESRGALRCLSWPLRRAEDAGAHMFLAAIRFPDRADPPNGATLTVRGTAPTDGGEAATLTFQLPAAPTNGPTFGQQVARLAGGGGPHRAAVTRFILNVLRPPPPGDGRRAALEAAAGTMLLAFLSQAAESDGCIEIMAAVPDGCVLLQGWGAGIAGPVQVVLAGAAGLPLFAAHAGEFARTDIAPPATGTLLALPPAAADALPNLEHVFVLSDQGLHSRTLVEHRLLDAASSLGHIRHVLGASVRCGPPMQALLQDTLRPRYEGRDTLGSHAHPVRAAIDFAASAPGGVGAYLAGWVFDPRRLVAELHLRGTSGFSARLDTTWIRVSRPDIPEAFRNAPGFPPLPPDAEAGFAVSTAAAPEPGEALYLQFTFADGDRAFLPVPAEDPALPAVRARLLAGVDLFKPSGLAIIERHLAPLMARVRPACDAPAAQVLLQGPTERKHAVVVPLATPGLPRAFLSGFLHDPLGGQEHLVLVCGPEWTQPGLDALRNLVGFYGLPATILTTPDTAGPMAALRTAAAKAPPGTDGFLVAGPGVSGRAAGWRQALREAAAAAAIAAGSRKGVAFACPTLLYEDWSVRYAGSAELRFLDAAPYAQVLAPMAGMPGALVGGDAPAATRAVPARMGTLECCLVQRPAALAALDDRKGALTTDAGQEAAFFLGLRAAGLEGLWVPSVQVYAPEDAAEASPGGGRIGTAAARLSDGWVLRHAWRHASREGER